MRLRRLSTAASGRGHPRAQARISRAKLPAGAGAVHERGPHDRHARGRPRRAPQQQCFRRELRSRVGVRGMRIVLVAERARAQSSPLTMTLLMNTSRGTPARAACSARRRVACTFTRSNVASSSGPGRIAWTCSAAACTRSHRCRRVPRPSRSPDRAHRPGRVSTDAGHVAAPAGGRRTAARTRQPASHRAATTWRPTIPSHRSRARACRTAPRAGRPGHGRPEARRTSRSFTGKRSSSRRAAGWSRRRSGGRRAAFRS